MLAWVSVAAAAPDTFGNGDGSDGALDVTIGRHAPVNASSPLTVAAAVATTTLDVGNPGFFAAGDLVMVHRTHVEAGVPPLAGSPGPWALGGNTAVWQLVRLSAVAGHTLTFDPPLTHAAPLGTQVVRVPEYTTVTVSLGATLPAPFYDRSAQAGGILAFLARDGVTIDGALSAEAAGSSGGEVVQGGSSVECASQSYASATDAGEKGLSVAPPPTLAFGRTEYANGGGGGNCHNGSGGGGGNGGRGGGGGDTWVDFSSNRSTGGLALTFAPEDHLPLGGGGGSGHDNEGEGTDGGDGGGIVFVRTTLLTLRGRVDVSGDDAGDAGDDGAGGGGAGGTALLIADRIACDAGGVLTGEGGRGGDVDTDDFGGGGGGGGGAVFLRTLEESGCATQLAAGLAGSGSDSAPHGATDGGAGRSDVGPSPDRDADADGFFDADEVLIGSDPLDADTDGDGLDDGLDGAPLDADADDDAVPDGADPDPNDPDADHDGVSDGVETGATTGVAPGVSSPGGVLYAGTDGSPPLDEDPSTTTNPKDTDSDDDGHLDGAEDANGDGEVDTGESDPLDPSDPGTPPDPTDGDPDDTAATEVPGLDSPPDPGCGCDTAGGALPAPLVVVALLRRRRRG